MKDAGYERSLSEMLCVVLCVSLSKMLYDAVCESFGITVCEIIGIAV